MAGGGQRRFAKSDIDRGIPSGLLRAESFLYTKGANPMALEFYKMMQTEGAGTNKIAKIELVDLTPEDVKKAAEVMTGPDGSKAQLPLKPTKKLKISVETKDANGSSTS